MAYNNAIFYQQLIEKLNELFVNRNKEVLIANKGGGSSTFRPDIVVKVGVEKNSRPCFEVYAIYQYQDPGAYPDKIFGIHDVLGCAKFVVDGVDLLAVNGTSSVEHPGRKVWLDSVDAFLINARKGLRYEPFKDTPA